MKVDFTDIFFQFVYEGKPEYQDVMRWALEVTYCYKVYK